MVEENKGEAPEVQEPAQQEEGDLRSQLSQLQQELEKAREEAKAHQREVSKKAAQLKEQEEFKANIKNIEDRMEVITAMLADIVDKDDLSEAEPTQKRSSEYLKQLEEKEEKRKREQEKSLQQEFLLKAQEADRLAKEAGLDMESSPELEDALLWFRLGEPDKGLKKVKEVTSKMKAEGKPNEVDIEKLVEERLQAKLKEAGLLTPEASTPSSSGERVYTLSEIAEMTPQEFAKEFEGKSTLQLIREGKIIEK
jgi:hypothetical protein